MTACEGSLLSAEPSGAKARLHLRSNVGAKAPTHKNSGRMKRDCEKIEGANEERDVCENKRPKKHPDISFGK
jgi:hypothetical protein